MTVNAVNGADNRGRNAAIGAGVGLVGGGAAGYFTKSILKDGNFTDEFVNKTILAGAKDDQTKNVVNAARKISEIAEDAPVDKMKKVLSKFGESIAEAIGEDKEVFKKALTEGSDDEIKGMFGTLKEGIGSLYETMKTQTVETLDSVYDKSAKKFKDLASDAAEETKNALSEAKKLVRNIKLKPAAIYGAAAAVVAGLVAYAATPKGEKAAEAEKIS